METNSTAPEAGPAPDDVKGDSTGSGQSAEGAAGSAPSSGAPGAAGSDRRADAAAAPGTGIGFSAWLRRLGVPRRAGWLGGVCAGVGARLGIDPIILRGIVVVVAVLGAPFVLLYAIAWLLLPDVDGEIHFERLTRGVVDPAIVGIAVMGVIGFVPLVQGGWLGWRWWPDWSVAGIDVLWPLRVLWVMAVVAGLVVLVIWLARRASQHSPGGGGPRMASAGAAAGPGNPAGTYPFPPAERPAAAATGAVAFTAAATTAPETAPAAPPADATAEPPVPAEGADAAAIAEWRAQHEAWRLSHAAWKTAQQDADRAARARAAAENKERAIALTALAEEARAERRASRPRASAAYVCTAIGIALVAGSIAAIWALGAADVADFAIPIAFAVATIVLALGMFVAALRRRRSGSLAFFATLTTASMLVAVAGASIMPQGALVPPSYGIAVDHSQRLVQPFGDAYFYVTPRFDSGTPTIELSQGTGDTWITIDQGARVLLDAAEAGAIELFISSPDGSTESMPQLGDTDSRVLLLGGDTGVISPAEGGAETADVRIVLTQQSGDVHVDIREGA
ncbi:PspC domain-containing protein [Agromyces ramosus]|uniref:Phage shock protein PspC (Stress-responsive transcriptional regulator)/FtsH-binding integral membrane protein n=1 Tax=Agromyces ramosus TaxID=33879 RepID=A0ABU0R9F7_9MICO|nr:PspC domain-containing protein [Agromyces ramosus]MDQ0894708.1 phage shock protein PspC (stress-responsive transcriptional regulator)/FtsH-binding integral membrane protein [Agromyces ramosus]